MPLDKNPLFRKVILPWYDTKKVCFTVIVFMLIILLFGIAGILEALDKIEYHEYIWVPILLIAMSVGVIASTSIRLIKRYTLQLSKQNPKF